MFSRIKSAVQSVTGALAAIVALQMITIVILVFQLAELRDMIGNDEIQTKLISLEGTVQEARLEASYATDAAERAADAAEKAEQEVNGISIMGVRCQ